MDSELIQTEKGRAKGRYVYILPRSSLDDALVIQNDRRSEQSGAWRGGVVAKVCKGGRILFSLNPKTGSVILLLVPSHRNQSVDEQVENRYASDALIVTLV